MAVETRVIIDANASNAIKEIGKLDQAAEDADKTIKALDDQTVDVDVNTDGMDRLRDAGEKAVAQVKALDDQRVDIDVDADKLNRVKGKLDEVGESGRAGGTAIGAIGGSISELPGVGALGPIAESLGQLTENALEGGESLKGIVGALGLMGGAAVALQVINKAMSSMAESKAFREERVKNFTDALRDGTSAYQALNDEIRETETLTGRVGGMAGFFEGTEDISDDLARMGLKWEEVNAAIAGTDEAFQSFIAPFEQKLNDIKSEHPHGFLGILESDDQTARLDDMKDIIETLKEAHTDLGTSEQDAADKAKFFGEALVDTTTASDNAAAAIARQEKNLEGATTATDNLRLANEKLRGDLNKRDAYLALLDSFDDLKVKGMEAMAAVMDKTGDAEGKMRDYEQAQIDVKNQVIDYTEVVGDVPVNVTTKLLAEVDDGQLDNLKGDIDHLTSKTHVVNVKFNSIFNTPAEQEIIRLYGRRP